MMIGCVQGLLRAFAALPGAGAASNLNSFPCANCNEISLWVLYQCNAGFANGAPTLRVRWTFPAVLWDPTGGQAEGTLINGAGQLAVEDWPFVTPGAAAANWVRLVILKVPPGAQSFDGTIRETGTAANPGNAAVMAVAGMT